MFSKGLFTWELQNIDFNKQRELLIKCTLCSYKKIVKIQGFQSSNFIQHYKYKYLTIAYNEKAESIKLLINNIQPKSDFLITN